MDEVSLVEGDGMCGIRLMAGDRNCTVTFRTTGPLGGYIRRTGEGRPIDRPLAGDVQPQQGLALEE